MTSAPRSTSGMVIAAGPRAEHSRTRMPCSGASGAMVAVPPRIGNRDKNDVPTERSAYDAGSWRSDVAYLTHSQLRPKGTARRGRETREEPP